VFGGAAMPPPGGGRRPIAIQLLIDRVRQDI